MSFMRMQQNQSSISSLGLLIWILVAVFFLYQFFLRACFGTLTEPIMSDFQLNVFTFGLLSSIYYLAYTVMQSIF